MTDNMMDSLSLYEDSALFGGDWMVGLELTPAEPSQDEDGLKPLKSKSGGQSEDDLVRSLLTSMENTMDQDLSDPFGASWMDTKVDLMDLIMGADDDGDQGVQSADEVQPLFGQDNILPATEATGLNVLKDIAEKTVAELELSSSTGSATVMDLDDFGEHLYVDVDSPEWISPVLSPMSPADVDSVLSSGPTSPATSSPDITIDLVQMLGPYEEEWPKSESEQELAPPVKKSRCSPYEKPVRSVSERKSRKKQQNKDAATRYRQKKKSEVNNINHECETLEARNKELKEKVDQMTREIQYLKDLMADVYKRKGLIKNEKRK